MTHTLKTVDTTPSNDDILVGRNVKKNAFQRKTPEAYQLELIEQIEDNIIAVLLGKIKSASMITRNKRTGDYRFRIGLGGKNEYVANVYHSRDDHLEYGSLKELSDALHLVLKKAKNGEFDKSLAELCHKRQKRADLMVAAQKNKKGVFGKVDEAA
jgi:hypothetical protein